jgi:hypothetical protein
MSAVIVLCGLALIVLGMVAYVVVATAGGDPNLDGGA